MSDPDASPFSIKAILRTLTEHRVNFVVVGVAGAAHGAARVTRDFDITPQWQADNLDRLSKALKSIDAKLRVPGSAPNPRQLVFHPLSGEAPANLEVSTWRTSHGDLDIVSGTPKESGGLAGHDESSTRVSDAKACGLVLGARHDR